MNAPSSLRLLARLLWILPCVPHPAAAQHVLLADNDGQMSLVSRADGIRPCVERQGKLVPITTRGFALQEVQEYAPFFVTVRDVAVRTSYTMDSGGAGEFNNDFHFNATFETPYLLPDVFVVIALKTERVGRTLFLWEVGTLEPHVPRNVAIVVPMKSAIGAGQYDFHLFSGGAEVLQSLLPIGAAETALDRIVANRIRDVHSAAPKVLIGAAPVYPPELKKANLKGHAVVSVRIGTNGAVLDPSVKSATDPAFGEAALRAVRLWRFLPRVKDDRPVESRADVPILFDPPNPVADKS